MGGGGGRRAEVGLCVDLVFRFDRLFMSGLSSNLISLLLSFTPPFRA